MTGYFEDSIAVVLDAIVPGSVYSKIELDVIDTSSSKALQ